MLEGIRHHKDSAELYREYLCLELHFIEMLHEKDGKETENEIKDGKIAKIVLKQALGDIPDDPKFETELLSLIFHFPLAKVRTSLLEHFVELRGESPASWDALARIHLIDRMIDDGRNVADKIEQCINVYQRAVKKLPTSKMFDKYLSTLFELCRSVAKDEAEKVFMTVKVLDAFGLAEEVDILTDEHRQIFKNLIDGDSN